MQANRVDTGPWDPTWVPRQMEQHQKDRTRPAGPRVSSLISPRRDHPRESRRVQATVDMFWLGACARGAEVVVSGYADFTDGEGKYKKAETTS
jgi:hypothetical protein